MSTETTHCLPVALQGLRTRPLFVLQLKVRVPEVIGPAPSGMRRVAVIAGGAFEGERLSGEVLDGGADWQTMRGDGVWSLDVRLVLKANDGDIIGMTYRGLRHGPPEVMARIAGGEEVDPSEYYFRTAPVFETASPKYGWLNRLLAIGAGYRRADGPVYSIFEVL